jgi:hypothetical protein
LKNEAKNRFWENDFQKMSFWEKIFGHFPKKKVFGIEYLGKKKSLGTWSAERRAKNKRKEGHRISRPERGNPAIATRQRPMSTRRERRAAVMIDR